MPDEWQLRRSELNHQWLKNELIRHLRAFVARLEATDPDEKRIAEFAREDWPKFAARREEIIDLLVSAEQALSPQRLFEQTPLSRFEPGMRAWLSRLVHDLWLARTPVKQQICAAGVALDSATRLYMELDALVVSAEPEVLRPALESLVAFEGDVMRLSACLSQLPRKVQVA